MAFDMTKKEVAKLVKSRIQPNRSIEEITRRAADFLMNTYGLELKIPVKANGRLTQAFGQYVTDYLDNPISIDIAKRVVEYAREDSLMNTIKHECMHYALHTLGKPCDDGNPYFEAELLKHNAPRVYETLQVGKLYQHTCKKCNRHYNRIKPMYEGEFVCHCDGELVISKLLISDGFSITGGINFI